MFDNNGMFPTETLIIGSLVYFLNLTKHKFRALQRVGPYLFNDYTAIFGSGKLQIDESVRREAHSEVQNSLHKPRASL